MKHTFLTFILIGFLTSLKAQNSNLVYGISSSIDFNSYIFVNDNGPKEFQGKFNYSAGFVLKYIINDKLTATTKALYSTKNFQESIDFNQYRPISPDDPLLLNGELTVTYKNKYIDIPFELNYRLNQEDKIGMLICFGFVSSFLIDYGNTTNTNSSINELKSYKDYLLGVKLGFGIHLKMGEIGLHIEPQTKIYLSKVHIEYPDENPIHFGIELQILKY